MRSRTTLASVAIVTLGLAAADAQQPASTGTAQSPIRTGVALVQLDVSVLDRNNQPVRGLTAADFTILDEGTAQPVASFVPVVLTATTSPGSATSRRVVIVMDDALTGVDRGQPTAAKEIARRIVSELEPSDLATVTFTYLPAQFSFTSDRRRLLGAVESYTPKSWTPTSNEWRTDGKTTGGESRSMLMADGGPSLGCRTRGGGCVLETLTQISTALASIGPERKLVMLISSNPAVGIREDPTRQGWLKDTLQALQRANVAVYAFDPQGVVGRGDDESRQSRHGLLTIAEGTGGRGITGTNAPESAVREVFSQNSSYYLLGFRPTDTTDGRFHRLSVKVNRSDVDVRTRMGYDVSK